VIATTDRSGDILSDEMAGLVGGLGMDPGATIGKDAAIVEAVHGWAPDIAGKGLAHPPALLLAAGSMLEYGERGVLARRLREAVDCTPHKEGIRTPDLGGKASTVDFAKPIAWQVEGQLVEASRSPLQTSGREQMAVHKLSMIERKPGGFPAPNPAECGEHYKAGRIPIFHGTRLVAYVDRQEDLPEAKFVERDNRILGEVARWEHGS
jgi:hypothetical protein